MGKWVKDEHGIEQYCYTAKELRGIAYGYRNYRLTPDNISLKAGDWEGLIDTKADFDSALKSLSPYEQRFIQLIIRRMAITDEELELRGFPEAEELGKKIFKQVANYLNGGENEV